MLQWFAVQTNPRAEARAAAGLRERGFDVFLPEETHWKRSRAKVRERVNTPLLTGYLFVGLNPGKSLYDVRLQDGVRGIVQGTNGEPVEIGWRSRVDHRGKIIRDDRGEPVKFHFVYELRARQAAGEFDHTPARRSAFCKGGKARLLNGPFKDHVGEMLSADDQGRVTLLLEGIFGGRLVVDDDHLEPVPMAA